jgi:small subunit ribosomal protein S17
MSEDEKKDETTEETPVQDEDAQSADEASEAPSAEEASAPEAEDEAPAADDAPAPKADKAEAEGSPEDELPWKEKRRLERSRKPHQAGPKLSVEERAAKRVEARKVKATLRRKQRAEAKTKRGDAGAGTPPAERTANAAKVRQGIVVSDKGEKSITVRIDIVRRHPTYEKVVRSSRTLHAHDEQNEANKGDTVRVVETRPLSKTKRWRLIDVVERAR